MWVCATLLRQCSRSHATGKSERTAHIPAERTRLLWRSFPMQARDASQVWRGPLLRPVLRVQVLFAEALGEARGRATLLNFSTLASEYASARTHPSHICIGTARLHVSRTCAGTGLTPATSAPGLSGLVHLGLEALPSCVQPLAELAACKAVRKVAEDRAANGGSL